MAKFAIIYSGGAGMEMEPEKRQQVMAEWGAWYGQMGEAIVDGGAPFAASKHLVKLGIVEDGPLGSHPPTGYTVIEAADIDEAAAKCAAHPHLNHGGQVTVFECIQM